MSIKKIILYIVCVLYLPACSTSVSKRHMYNEQKEQKLSSTQYFKRIIKNYQKVNSRPLVIIAGSSMYKTQRGNFRNFPSVYEQIKNTTRVFRNNSKYTVVSNHKGHNNQSKKVSLNQLKNFIDKQVIYLRNNEKNYNSVIFIWYGKSYDAGIITSDNKQLKSEYIRQRLFEDSNIYDNIPEMEIINPKKELIINKKDNKDLDQIIFLDKQSKQKNLNQENNDVYSEGIYKDHLNVNIRHQSKQLPDNNKKTKNCPKPLDINNSLRNSSDYIKIYESFHEKSLNFFNKGNYDKAIKFEEKCLSIMKKIYNNTVHDNISRPFLNLGLMHEMKGNYKEALKYRLLSLNIHKRIYDCIDFPNINISLDSISTKYHTLRDYGESSKFNLSSKNNKKHIRKNEVRKFILDGLYFVRATYDLIGDHRSKLKYTLESLNLTKELHNNVVNKKTIEVIDQVALNYQLLKDYTNSLEYYLESLKMKKIFYPNSINDDIANSLNNIGNCFYYLDNYKMALKYSLDCLSMKKSIHGNLTDSNECFSSVLYSLGHIYFSLKDFKRALEYFLEGLKIKRKFYVNSVDKDTMLLLLNIGKSYFKLGKMDKASKYLLEGLSMRGENHSIILYESNNLLADIYLFKNQINKSIKYYMDALEIIRIIHCNRPHMYIANILYSIGFAYHISKNFQNALKYSLESLEMKKKIYGNKPHKDILKSLNFLPDIYHSLGDFENEFKCNLEISNMEKALDKSN